MSPAAPRVSVAGFALALASAASYAVAGPFGKALGEGGWSVGAVVAFRTGFAALFFAIPMMVELRRLRGLSRSWLWQILRYGVIAMAGVQLCFYTALQYAPVAIVLLIEYLAPVILMLWMWSRTRVRPPGRVLGGAAVAVLGLVLVIGIGGSVQVNPLGVFWALAAGCCLAAYFGLASGRSDGTHPPPVLLVGGGLAVSGVVVLAAGWLGLWPLAATWGEVPLAGASAAWWLPAGGLVVFAGVSAYLTGIMAIRRLGSRRASFLALTEVLFAAVVAWVLLGEQPSLTQGVGAVAVLAGVLTVQFAND